MIAKTSVLKYVELQNMTDQWATTATPQNAPNPATVLSVDHCELDKLLGALKAAFENDDVPGIVAPLDVFWARLAMHIRAEHLHLFPTVLRALKEHDAAGLIQAQKTIVELRSDHDFFMHQLALAMQTMRELRRMDGSDAKLKVEEVREAIAQVEKRLVIHNQTEEKGVYVWARDILNEREQTGLAGLIHIEISNLPPRFSTRPELRK